MLTEICVFVFVFGILMAKMKNKREWLYNIKRYRRNNWRKKWHGIPVTKLVFVLFVLLLVSALLSSFFSFEINYIVWDFFFVLHYSLFLIAGASLYLFVWCLGGRAVHMGSDVGKLSPVEGTEPSGRKKTEKETFIDGMFKSVFDVAFGKSEKKRKRKE